MTALVTKMISNRLHFKFLTCILLLVSQSYAQINNSTNSSLMLQALTPPEGRIVNGTPAKVGQFPYQVLVMSIKKIVCGGAIIDKNTVLTVAQCVTNPEGKEISADDIQVSGGDVDLNSKNMKKFRVESVHRHADYDRKAFTDDIAILKMKDNFWEESSSENIAAIPITSMDFPTNTECVLAGWGRTGGSEVQPNELLFANYKIYGHVKCALLYATSGLEVTDSMLCASSKKSSFCQGDEGGALVCTDKDKKNYLAGVLAAGYQDCTVNTPSVYTSAYKYQDWIKKTSNAATSHVMRFNHFVLYGLLSTLIIYFK